MIKQAYIRGFMRKCAEYGITDPHIVKQALFGALGRGISQGYATKVQRDIDAVNTADSNYQKQYGNKPTMFQRLNPFSNYNVLQYKNKLGIGPNSYPTAEAGSKAVTDANGRILNARQISRGAYDNGLYRNGHRLGWGDSLDAAHKAYEYRTNRRFGPGASTARVEPGSARKKPGAPAGFPQGNSGYVNPDSIMVNGGPHDPNQYAAGDLRKAYEEYASRNKPTEQKSGLGMMGRFQQSQNRLAAMPENIRKQYQAMLRGESGTGQADEFEDYRNGTLAAVQGEDGQSYTQDGKLIPNF